MGRRVRGDGDRQPQDPHIRPSHPVQPQQPRKLEPTDVPKVQPDIPVDQPAPSEQIVIRPDQPELVERPTADPITPNAGDITPETMGQVEQLQLDMPELEITPGTTAAIRAMADPLVPETDDRPEPSPDVDVIEPTFQVTEPETVEATDQIEAEPEQPVKPKRKRAPAKKEVTAKKKAPAKSRKVKPKAGTTDAIAQIEGKTTTLDPRLEPGEVLNLETGEVTIQDPSQVQAEPTISEDIKPDPPEQTEPTTPEETEAALRVRLTAEIAGRNPGTDTLRAYIAAKTDYNRIRGYGPPRLARVVDSLINTLETLGHNTETVSLIRADEILREFQKEMEADRWGTSDFGKRTGKATLQGARRLPRTMMRKNIERNVRRAWWWMTRGWFPLRGDDPNTGFPSDEVFGAVNDFLKFIGYPPVKEKKDWRDASRVSMVYLAFLIYRGVSLDRNGRLFGEKDNLIYDSVFIAALTEMKSNISNYQHPFAYSNPSANFANKYRYPVLAPSSLAEFFTAGELGNKLRITKEEFMRANAQTWKEKVEPRMLLRADIGQREVMLDMADAVLENDPDAWIYDLQSRSAESRLTLSELLDSANEFAHQYNLPEVLIEVQQERIARIMRALEHQEKPYAKAQNVIEVGESLTSWTRKASILNPIATTVTNTGVLMGVVAMPQISIMGALEKARGLGDVWTTLKIMKALAKQRGLDVDVKPETFLFLEQSNITKSVGSMIHMMGAAGIPALIDAGTKGIEWDSDDAKRIAKEANEMATASSKFATRVGQVLDGSANFWMSVSVGDWLGTKLTAKVFFEQLVLEFALTAERGGPVVTSEQLQDMLISNPNKFFSDMVQTPEGIRALRYASESSLAGVDPAVEAFRKSTANPLVRAAVGFTLSWYLRFGIRAAIRLTPFSHTMIYLTKMGVINPLRLAAEDRGLLKKDSTKDADEYMLGSGLGSQGFLQCVLLDLVQFASLHSAVLFLYALIAFLGGVEEPDDEEKRHIWYEWKLKDTGQAFRESWYWTELLGFGMPIAIAIHAGLSQDADADITSDIVRFGAAEKMFENPWANASDMYDFFNNFDRGMVEAQTRADGYIDPSNIDGQNYAITQMMVWAMRRGYATFEPAIIRSIYNMNVGERLARSPNLVYTALQDTEDGELPKTEPTTWQDAQIRRALMPSPTSGLLMNFIQTVGAENEERQRTGYLRHEMPLVSNVDPINQFWADRLSVRDPETGELSPPEQWTEEQRQERINLVIRLLNEFPPAALASQGVVIPLDIRIQTRNYLVENRRAIRNEFEYRKAKGEWSRSNGRPIEENRANQNKAWAEVEKRQGELDVLLSALRGDEIPYSPMRYNRWETSYRPIYTWKEGTPNAGEPATKWDYRWNRNEVDVVFYASGDYRGSFFPWGAVQDRGDRSFDAQTPVSWQTPLTDEDWLRQEIGDYTVQRGMFEGRSLWDLATGGGATGPGAPTNVPWETGELLVGSRALQPQRMPEQKMPPLEIEEPTAAAARAAGAVGYTSWGRGGGGRRAFAPRIYSNEAVSLNPDRPKTIFNQNLDHTKFDFLRPEFRTKGSREAFQREDF